MTAAAAVIIDSFQGRHDKDTQMPVCVYLIRDNDMFAVEFCSGYKHEYYEGLSREDAEDKFEKARRWWGWR